jgi:hypothetical protein
MVLGAKRYGEEVTSPLSHALPMSKVMDLCGRVVKAKMFTEDAADLGHTV